MEIEISNENKLVEVAERLLSFCPKHSYFVFNGEMGAGKTTLIKSLVKKMGVDEVVSSPTYSIVNEYSSGNKLIYHFDFYRLKDEFEALDFGLEEYLDSGNICLMEWAEKIENLLPENYVEVNILKKGESRVFTIKEKS